MTIEDVPRIGIIDEDGLSQKMVQPGPFYHSWLRKEPTGVVGIKFSSWMISQGLLSKKEKEIISKWNKSKTDFEIYFSGREEYDTEISNDEVVTNTSILKLAKNSYAMAFPLFGSTIGKTEMSVLESNLLLWQK